MSQFLESTKKYYHELVTDYLHRLLNDETIDDDEVNKVDDNEDDMDKEDRDRDIRIRKEALALAREFYQRMDDWSNEKYGERYRFD